VVVLIQECVSKEISTECAVATWLSYSTWVTIVPQAFKLVAPRRARNYHLWLAPWRNECKAWGTKVNMGKYLNKLRVYTRKSVGQLRDLANRLHCIYPWLALCIYNTYSYQPNLRKSASMAYCALVWHCWLPTVEGNYLIDYCSYNYAGDIEESYYSLSTQATTPTTTVPTI
jgi:hypothetical protein